ncbi:MAG: type II CRISPR RNA-guided endonuclease Cas9, partial [Flavobacteriales bacterium]
MKTKRILGLDLGTGSIGWALVEESRNDLKELVEAQIIKLGVRVNPLTVDEKKDFESGKPLTTNADRTLKRGARRNLQRYKLRRESLVKTLVDNKLITHQTPLTEIGKGTTHYTLSMRAKAAKERVELEDLARIFLMINKKRGYKSSRKTKSGDEGVAIDGMGIAKYLYDYEITPGQYVLGLLAEKKISIPDFYRSDLQREFLAIWEKQSSFYPEILTDDLFQKLQDKNKSQTWAICQEPFSIVGIKLAGKKNEQQLQKYQLRVSGLSEQLNLEHLAIVLQEINNDMNQSSGYLGAISDRSKILYIDKKTVGRYLYEQLQENRHTSLKNQVFYRQDYLDEFEQIWTTQAQHHPVLTEDLKDEIRDIIIFYQRKLKSQKGQLGFCQFESWEEDRKDKKGNIVLNKSTGLPKKRQLGRRVISKSSPLFQEFKIWQNINNLKFISKDKSEHFELDLSQKQALFEELNINKQLTEKQVLKFFKLSDKLWKTNQPLVDRKSNKVKPLEGNRTNAALYDVYQEIAKQKGYGFEWQKKTAKDINEELKAIFPDLGLNPELLNFDVNIEGSAFDKQKSYQLWHLLYSAEDDGKIEESDRLLYGDTDVKLRKKLHKIFGFEPEFAKLMSAVKLQDDYGSLSSKAIRKIIIHLQKGHEYSEACSLAGYKHSDSKTSEDRAQEVLKDCLELLPKNSLRNPVVEKILNQMVNVVNQVSETYGKPDEIRIELARELKKSAKERKDMTQNIASATRENEDIRQKILKDFGFTATRNDVIRYKLWRELDKRGYKTVFSDRCIPYEKLFSKEVDIEHIIPKALLFDDSFSNKTLAYRDVNLKKSNRTALDFMQEDYHSELENYKARVEDLYKSNSIGRSKYMKLLKPADELSEGFIARDLRNTQYIAKKAKEMLEEVFGTVISTTGKITDELRSDWDLINVMKELNFPKYKAVGLTEIQTRWDNGREKEKEVEIIKDWTKRNDHRHHAMDALTVAFTSHNHIQYINYKNARRNENHNMHARLLAIERLITETKKGKTVFVPPMENFRAEAKKQMESILISIKTKNKVVTKNINTIKVKSGTLSKTQLTPRGQLHKETVYGKSKRLMEKATKINKKLTLEKIALIENKAQRQLILDHLSLFENKPELAFDTKTLKKTPLLWKKEPLKEVFCFEELYTIRKDIGPDLKLDKVIDKHIQSILKTRLEKFNGDKKKAFSDLDKQPIWLNEAQGIAIKRVTIKGVVNAEALHVAKDHLGKVIVDEKGRKQAVDFVSLGNNHHIAIYQDKEGNLKEKVVSLYEAVARKTQDLDVVDKCYNQDLGWTFQFTMKQNEMFVFPNEAEDFDPSTIDLLDEKHSSLISK